MAAAPGPKQNPGNESESASSVAENPGKPNLSGTFTFPTSTEPLPLLGCGPEKTVVVTQTVFATASTSNIWTYYDWHVYIYMEYAGDLFHIPFHFFTFRFSSCFCPIKTLVPLEIFRALANSSGWELLFPCVFLLPSHFWFYFWERRGQDLILSPTSEKEGHLRCILGIDVFRWRTG